jgi:hypothetical protein
MFGVGYDSTDTTLQFMHRGTGAVTKLPLATLPVPIVDNTSMYQLVMFVAPNSTSLSFTVTNLTTGATESGTVTTNLPAVNSLLYPRGYCSAGGTSSVIGISLSSLYLETEY